MLAREESAAPGPVVVMDVPSIDDALQTVERLGGSTVVPKQPVGDMGFTAYVKDPRATSSASGRPRRTADRTVRRCRPSTAERPPRQGPAGPAR